MLQNRQEGLAVRARVQRLTAVSAIWIATEVGIMPASVEQGREVRLELGAQEVRIAWSAAERWPKRRSERARIVRAMLTGQLVSPTSRYRKPAQRRYRLDKRRLSGAILANKKSDCRLELQIEVSNDWQRERIAIVAFDTFGNDPYTRQIRDGVHMVTSAYERRSRRVLQRCDVAAVGSNFCSRCPYVSAAYTAPRESTTTPCTQSNSPGPSPCFPHVARIFPSFNAIL